MRALVSTSS
jgi:hypothetical protein